MMVNIGLKKIATTNQKIQTENDMNQNIISHYENTVYIYL